MDDYSPKSEIKIQDQNNLKIEEESRIRDETEIDMKDGMRMRLMQT